jgi:hypothetical protein
LGVGFLLALPEADLTQEKPPQFLNFVPEMHLSKKGTFVCFVTLLKWIFILKWIFNRFNRTLGLLE